ncbi:MAG: hypothetical protein H6630_07805 [Arcobacter sp.]|nr:hypothetical protein [Arcobacter sp.]
MSQEEIEALMNGLEIEDDGGDSEEVSETVKVNTKEIEDLLSQTEDLKESPPIIEEDVVNDVSFEDISAENHTLVDNSEIEDLLKDIEATNEIKEDFEVQETLPVVENLKEVKSESKKNERTEDEIVKDWTSSKISEGIFPFPAEKDTKVVNQLSQVANDSEEKVSQIFDVLSLTLDNNGEIRKKIKLYEEFVNSQINLLNSLNSRFPNIKVFNEHLNSANNVNTSMADLKKLLNEEDNQIFQGMELMQFNDINRQKIERVMSVIRKLSLYLNNLFEDDGTGKEVAVARHIHGDTTNDLIGDDLDKLIAEFSNK